MTSGGPFRPQTSYDSIFSPLQRLNAQKKRWIVPTGTQAQLTAGTSCAFGSRAAKGRCPGSSVALPGFPCLELCPQPLLRSDNLFPNSGRAVGGGVGPISPTALPFPSPEPRPVGAARARSPACGGDALSGAGGFGGQRAPCRGGTARGAGERCGSGSGCEDGDVPASAARSRRGNGDGSHVCCCVPGALPAPPSPLADGGGCVRPRCYSTPLWEGIERAA